MAAGFSENQVLGNLYADVLEAAGFDASVKPVTNREVYLPALERGEVQVAAEYVGTLTEFLNKKKNGPDAPALASGDLDATVAALTPLADGGRAHGRSRRRPRPTRTPSPSPRPSPTPTGSRRCRTSPAYKGDLVLGGPPECPTRPFCQPGLEKTYGLDVRLLRLARRRRPAHQDRAEAGQGPGRARLLQRRLARPPVGRLVASPAAARRPRRRAASRSPGGGERAGPRLVVGARRVVEEVEVDDQAAVGGAPRSAPLTVSSR